MEVSEEKLKKRQKRLTEASVPTRWRRCEALGTLSLLLIKFCSINLCCD